MAEEKTAREKGNSLEASVRAIEEVILRNSPAVKEYANCSRRTGIFHS